MASWRSRRTEYLEDCVAAAREQFAADLAFNDEQHNEYTVSRCQRSGWQVFYRESLLQEHLSEGLGAAEEKSAA